MVAVDVVGVLVRVARAAGGSARDVDTVRFVPWSAVEYVVLDPR